NAPAAMNLPRVGSPDKGLTVWSASVDLPYGDSVACGPTSAMGVALSSGSETSRADRAHPRRGRRERRPSRPSIRPAVPAAPIEMRLVGHGVRGDDAADHTGDVLALLGRQGRPVGDQPAL